MSQIKLFLALLLISGCIDPINLKVGQGSNLVVDGLVTDQTGMTTIKLTRSISYDNSRPLKVYSVAESNAKVYVMDELGNKFNFSESTVGNYQTSSLTGRVGGVYQLFIETASAKKYRSSMEELLPVPDVAGISYAFQVYDVLFFNTNGAARMQKMEGFGISVHVNDPPALKNSYRWQLDGIFEFFTSNIDPTIRQCWAPLTRLEPKLEIASDEYFDGQPYQQQVAVISYTRPTKFLVKLRQQSLTENYYKFLKGVSAQQTNTGTLFDPPPTALPGNMYSDDPTEKNPLGYFGVSAVKRFQVLIDRFVASNYSIPGRNIPIVIADCRTQEPFATNIKPEGF